jgi:hypothetical protein
MNRVGALWAAFRRYLKRIVILFVVLALGFALGAMLKSAGSGKPDARPPASAAPVASSSASAGPTSAGAIAAAGTISSGLEEMYLLTPAERTVIINKLVAPQIAAGLINQYDQIAPLLTGKLGLKTNVDSTALAYDYAAVIRTKLISFKGTTATVALFTSSYAGTRSGSLSLEVWSVNKDTMVWSHDTWLLTAASAVGQPQIVSSSAPASLAGALATLEGAT